MVSVSFSSRFSVHILPDWIGGISVPPWSEDGTLDTYHSGVNHYTMYTKEQAIIND